MHFLGSRHPGYAVVDTEMRREMEHFAERIGLNFILNVILNRDGELVDAVAGHDTKTIAPAWRNDPGLLRDHPRVGGYHPQQHHHRLRFFPG